MASPAEGLLLLALLTITPGPDTLLTIRQSVAGGVGVAARTAAGISAGTVVHGTLAGAGLALLLSRTPGAIGTIQVLGVAYLAYLGVRSLWAARRLPAAAPEEKAPRPRGAYRDGLLTNLLNPKVVLFYIAFLPQFLQPGWPVLAQGVLYGVAHACMGMAWLLAVAVGADRVRRLFSGERFRRGVEVAAGVVLLGFAVRLALL